MLWNAQKSTKLRKKPKKNYKNKNKKPTKQMVFCCFFSLWAKTIITVMRQQITSNKYWTTLICRWTEHTLRVWVCGSIAYRAAEKSAVHRVQQIDFDCDDDVILSIHPTKNYLTEITADDRKSIILKMIYDYTIYILRNNVLLICSFKSTNNNGTTAHIDNRTAVSRNPTEKHFRHTNIPSTG